METLTATVIINLLFSGLKIVGTEALKESGKELGKGVVGGITHVFTLIREKLQAAGTEGLLTRAEKQPTDEKTLSKLADELQTQIDEDKAFSDKLQQLIKEVVAKEPSLGTILTNIKVQGSIRAKDISQESSGSGTQKILTDLDVGGDIEVGNLTQKN
ncbi:MAG: hypothetical protein IM537_21025 [Pseudanabaena sp. M57BS1SP1A06MG]|nr:hypothetical protein [Pseudanabaena sp. M53BS1SP1A06MG]MCA6581415.1 hypothetical protein [Pseudanabaena sp. M34BS1SP1A06MG]MCA6592596.1 hypothetical protein [Pseudanabaena sp. M38BS1SP1A06MG]MCA6602621.1 hypothetical protein [Pseudanabaena sp. M57BS1SP1A06MG]